MRARGVVALVAILAAAGLSAAGCSLEWRSGGGSESGREPAAEAGASLPPPQSLLAEPRPVHRPATTAELRWLGSYNRWWADMAADLAFVASASDQILAGESPSPPDDRSLEDVFDRLRHCETELSRRIEYPRSERLRRLYALLVDACFAVEHVAAGGSRILVHGNDPRLVEDWRAQWTDAEGLLFEAYRRLSRFDPASGWTLPVRGGTSEESRVEPRFGKAASALAGKRIRVRCWSREDWIALMRGESLYTGGAVTAAHVGFAVVGGRDVNLAPEICSGLTALVYVGLRPAGAHRVYAAAAVGTLAHESFHSRGVADEPTTECFAVQAVRRTAALLGLERPYARALARVYWKRVYKLQPRGYRTPDCRSGGPLDLRPQQPAWP